MFSKSVTSCGLVCILTLILILPFAELQDRYDDDYSVQNNITPGRRKAINNSEKQKIDEDEDASNDNKNNSNNNGNTEENRNTTKIASVPLISTRIDFDNDSDNKYRNNRESNMAIKYIKDVVENIRLSVQFRENVIRAISYLLQISDNNTLTEEQYTALNLIYTVVREKRVYFFDLLPPVKSYLPQEAEKGKNCEMETVLKIVSVNLPKYMKCSAHFLIRELHYATLNVEAIISTYNPPEFIFNSFYQIDIKVINTIFSKNGILDIEKKSISPETKMINTVLGSAFTYVISKVIEDEIPLSQMIFVNILMNMPISPLDPVLEENILFIYKLGIQNKIPQWNKCKKKVSDMNPYRLLRKMIINILQVQKQNHNVINALIYILSHLQPIRKSPGNLILPELDETDKSTLIFLLDTITYPEYDSYTIDVKDRLITFIENSDFDTKLINLAFSRYTYDNSWDLLLSTLTQLQKSIMNIKKYDEVTKLLPMLISSLIFRKRTMIFSKFISKQLHIVDLLPWISYQGSKIVDVDPIIDKIITNNDEFISILTQPVNAEKTVCYAPLQCLQNSMNRTRSSMPTQLTQLLQEVQSNDQLETEYPVNNKNRYPNSNGKGNVNTFKPKQDFNDMNTDNNIENNDNNNNYIRDKVKTKGNQKIIGNNKGKSNNKGKKKIADNDEPEDDFDDNNTLGNNIQKNNSNNYMNMRDRLKNKGKKKIADNDEPEDDFDDNNKLGNNIQKNDNSNNYMNMRDRIKNKGKIKIADKDEPEDDFDDNNTLGNNDQKNDNSNNYMNMRDKLKNKGKKKIADNDKPEDDFDDNNTLSNNVQKNDNGNNNMNMRDKLKNKGKKKIVDKDEPEDDFDDNNTLGNNVQKNDNSNNYMNMRDKLKNKGKKKIVDKDEPEDDFDDNNTLGNNVQKNDNSNNYMNMRDKLKNKGKMKIADNDKPDDDFDDNNTLSNNVQKNDNGNNNMNMRDKLKNKGIKNIVDKDEPEDDFDDVDTTDKDVQNNENDNDNINIRDRLKNKGKKKIVEPENDLNDVGTVNNNQKNKNNQNSINTRGKPKTRGKTKILDNFEVENDFSDASIFHNNIQKSKNPNNQNNINTAGKSKNIGKNKKANNVELENEEIDENVPKNKINQNYKPNIPKNRGKQKIVDSMEVENDFSDISTSHKNVQKGRNNNNGINIRDKLINKRNKKNVDNVPSEDREDYVIQKNNSKLNVLGSRHLNSKTIGDIIEEILLDKNVIESSAEMKNIKPKKLMQILANIVQREKYSLEIIEIKAINKYLYVLKQLNAVPDIIIRQKNTAGIEVNVVINEILNQVIYFHELLMPNKIKYVKILQFIEKTPLVIQNSKINLFTHKTKGKFVQYLLETIMKLEETDQITKDNIKSIIPYIQLNGLGAENLIFTKNIQTRN